MTEEPQDQHEEEPEVADTDADEGSPEEIEDDPSTAKSDSPVEDLRGG